MGEAHGVSPWNGSTIVICYDDIICYDNMVAYIGLLAGLYVRTWEPVYAFYDGPKDHICTVYFMFMHLRLMHILCMA